MQHRFMPLLIIFLLMTSTISHGEEIETRYGAGLTPGYTYDPNETIYWLQGSILAQYDYDKIWPHRAPDSLRFKVEGHFGLTVEPKAKVITSVNMMAQYYLDSLATGSWHPYIEAGIGLIYTDFQVEGQGLRFNFNPQMGIGTDYTCKRGIDWFMGLRFHHISNGGIDDDNRGLNSITLTLGRYF